MGSTAVQHYLNPLTLEAQNFLNSMETYKNLNEIDNVLCSTLECIVLAIEQFLDKNPKQVMATESTKLVSLKEMAQIQRIYHCTWCKKDLGKTPDKAALHLVNRHRAKSTKETFKEKKQAERKQRENSLIKLPKKAKAIISNDLAKFFADHVQVAEKLKRIPEYQVIEQHLEQLITPLFPEKSFKLYMFGSRMTGIGTRNSDLDIFIDIGNTFNTFENRASNQTLSYLYRVRDALKKDTDHWQQLCVIDGARVPILKVSNVSTGIECDIGFSNSLGYCNTKLIDYLFQLQPIARRMCIFLKKWLERTRLNEHISTYSMTLMVIYFLQTKNHMPPIQAFQMNMLANVLVGPWIANFMEKKLSEFDMVTLDVSPPHCRQLLQEFCNYYANFKYDTYVVCPYFGKPNIEIKAIKNMLPERYTNFVKNESGSNDCGLQLNKCMVVQDPIQMNHNVTKSVSKYHLKEFIDYMRQSAEAFAELK